MTNAPGPMEPTSITTIPAAAGALYAETFVPPSTPKGVVVVTHGYADHCGRYREVAHVIVQAGWTALSYDVRGHGHSPGKRGYIDRFETYLDDLAAAQTLARTLVPAGAPMVLLGHSHGSLISLRALCSDHPPPNVKAAIVASPYLALKIVVPRYKRVLARITSRVAPGFTQPNGLRSEDLTHDIQKQAEHTADKLCFAIATARWFTEASSAQDYVAANAERIKIPTTWLVGGADPIADPSRSKVVANRVVGARYHDLVGMKHEVFNEVERGKVFAEVTRTLAASA
jgi:alpha-beta hydrolase superfamily lysophospholipase